MQKDFKQHTTQGANKMCCPTNVQAHLSFSGGIIATGKHKGEKEKANSLSWLSVLLFTIFIFNSLVGTIGLEPTTPTMSR